MILLFWIAIMRALGTCVKTSVFGQMIRKFNGLESKLVCTDSYGQTYPLTTREGVDDTSGLCLSVILLLSCVISQFTLRLAQKCSRYGVEDERHQRSGSALL